MAKIKIPKLDSELFEIVGYEHRKFEFSDKELGEHIAVLQCVCRYFKGLDDARMSFYQLQREYDILLGLKEKREHSP